MNITILGHVCIDKNTSENASYTAAGSPAMFMNKIFQQLPDVKTTIIAPYGKDFLEHKGNANLYPLVPSGETTLIYENISKMGTRTQKAHNRQNANPVPVDESIKKILADSNVVFVAPLMPNFLSTYLKEALSSSRNAFKVLLPQGYHRNFDNDDNVLVRQFSEQAEILPLVNGVIVSEQDHPDMEKLAKEWAQAYKIIVIVTKGEKGAVAITENEAVELPARLVPENEIVDSVGSGDIFSAGFAYRYQQKHDLKEAGRFANELSRQCLFYTPNEIKIDYEKLQ